MGFLHMIFFSSGIEGPIFPKKMYFGYTNRSGVVQTFYPKDMELLLSKRRFLVKSFYMSENYIIRSVEITSGQANAGVSFFRYEEPIPSTLTILYDQVKLDILINNFDLKSLIDNINNELLSDNFNYDNIVESAILNSKKLNDEALQKSLYWFVNVYREKIFRESYGMNIEELKKHSAMIAYKLYEMKEINDKGLVSKL
ncbi:MAG: hypothetical protein PWQ20_120 [Thermotogaceae bacterium]|nr:hypothetical protein [Thermotogaceae bacterium]MDN5337050.1 hypothetical protein [Thermotogaceae bacterium]